MPKLVEYPIIKKEITKIKNCTKKYRSAVRKYYKTSSKLRKYRGTDNTRRTALYKLSEKANDKANQIKVECNKSLFNLEDLMRDAKVVREETEDTIKTLFADLNKEELEWSSNTSSMNSELNK